MILDEVNTEICRSFDRRGWLPLLDVDHHSTSSNIQFVKSLIRGEEYVITPQVMVSALGVPLVQ